MLLFFLLSIVTASVDIATVSLSLFSFRKRSVGAGGYRFTPELTYLEELIMEHVASDIRSLIIPFVLKLFQSMEAEVDSLKSDQIWVFFFLCDYIP